jgi:predicted aspartyl protease
MRMFAFTAGKECRGRRHRAAAVTGVLSSAALACAAQAQPADPAGPPPAPDIAALPDITVAAPEPKYVAPTTRDRIGRIWAPVLINGQGPYRLVLDTGASGSAVTERVASRLQLPVYVDSVQLRGVTGEAVASSIRADTLEVGELLVENVTMPILADAFGGADGVLGAEGLRDKRIVIEFANDRITVARSRKQRASPGFVRVPFDWGGSKGMRVEVTIGTIRAIGLVDTGAQVTVGNLALREALARRRRAGDEMRDAIIGVTQDVQHAATLQVPSITAGDLIVRNPLIKFGDLYIFGHWKLTERPAILLGMDILGLVDTLIIDYRRSELQIRTRR